MRTKNLLIILGCVVLTSLLVILFSPAGQQNDSLQSIVSQTHQQLKEFHVSRISTVEYYFLVQCTGSNVVVPYLNQSNLIEFNYLNVFFG